MKVLCIGDIHIKVSNVPEIEEMTKKILILVDERKPHIVILMGDILDRHATINVFCLLAAEKIVSELSKLVPTFLIIGNHDRPNNSNFLTNQHPFNSMKMWKNTYIIDKVASYIFNLEENSLRTGNNKSNHEYRFILAPYVPPGRFDEALQTIENPFVDTDFFASHQEYVGAKMGAIVSTIGDKWSLDRALIISGHIHDYDMLQSNLIYVGVPLMHSFADKSNKTVSLFTFNKNPLKENDGKLCWSEERIDLGLIKKVTVYLSPSEVENYQPKENVQLKLVIKGDEAAIKTVAKLEKIKQLKKQGIKVVFKILENTNITSNKISQKMSFKERFVSEIDKDELKWFNLLFTFYGIV